MQTISETVTARRSRETTDEDREERRWLKDQLFMAMYRGTPDQEYVDAIVARMYPKPRRAAEEPE